MNNSGIKILSSAIEKEKFSSDWVANYTILSDDLSVCCDLADAKYGIDEILLKNLSEMGITRLFPVQHHIIPIILNSLVFGIGPCNYPPNDLCISAPTGSGKTLAFAIPIVQSLLNRVLPVTRAVVVLPTRELTAQVHSVFEGLCAGTSVTCMLAHGGMQTFEEKKLLSNKSNILHNNKQEQFQPDIIITTTGKLVDYLVESVLNFDQLRFLVLDEADRMLNQTENDWLSLLEKSVCRSRPNYNKLNVKNIFEPCVPFQKLLFSATLGGNAENLSVFNLFHPRLYVVSHPKRTEVTIQLQTSNTQTDSIESKSESYVADKKSDLMPLSSQPKSDSAARNMNHTGQGLALEKYATPALLEERMVTVSIQNKPLAVFQLIRSLNKVLCFTGSIETANRLALVIRLFGKKLGLESSFRCGKFSSKMTAKQRNAILNRFKQGDINVLVSSDSMARGIDVPDVSSVISYDVPRTIETYIHRIGRTARAGKFGIAYTLTLSSEAAGFKKMLKSAGKTIKKMSISSSVFKEFQPMYEDVLSSLGNAVKAKKV